MITRFYIVRPELVKFGTGICLFSTRKMGLSYLDCEPYTQKWKWDSGNIEMGEVIDPPSSSFSFRTLYMVKPGPM